MTDDNDVTSPQARCRPHLARLGLLAAGPPGTPLPADAAADVANLICAVLAEAEQAVSMAAASGQTAAGTLLLARLARLATAGAAAVSAARSGDAATLRSCLRQFAALTSALWTVHEAVTVPGSPDPGAQITAPAPLARRHADWGILDVQEAS